MNEKEARELDKQLRQLFIDQNDGKVEWRIAATMNDTAGKRIKLYCAQIADRALGNQIRTQIQTGITDAD
jgi:hypothetical protein